MIDRISGEGALAKKAQVGLLKERQQERKGTHWAWIDGASGEGDLAKKGQVGLWHRFVLCCLCKQARFDTSLFAAFNASKRASTPLCLLLLMQARALRHLFVCCF